MTSKQFRDIRRRLQLSLAELGAQMGASPLNIEQYESGSRKIRSYIAILLVAIAKSKGLVVRAVRGS